MLVIMVYQCTKLEFHRLSHSEDTADFWSRCSAAWWPWLLTFWPRNWCGMSPVVRTTFLPILMFLWVVVVELWTNCIRLMTGPHKWRWHLIFWPLNGTTGRPYHGLPSCPFSACYALPFSTLGLVQDRQWPSTLNASPRKGRRIMKLCFRISAIHIHSFWHVLCGRIVVCYPAARLQNGLLTRHCWRYLSLRN